MEHNTNIQSLPQEVTELIINYVSVADLFSVRLASKVMRANLVNQKIWKEACLRAFDIEFFDENSNWLELAPKYCTIDYNIRKSRVLVQACALSIAGNDNQYKGEYLFTRESYARDPNHLVVNWRRNTDWEDWDDYNDHTVILNVTTRQEEHILRDTPPERSLVVIGNKLAEHYRTDYNEHYYFPVTKSDLPPHEVLTQNLPGQTIRKVVNNTDPSMTHLVVIVDAPTLLVYDLNTNNVVKSFRVDNLPIREDLSREPNVIFHGRTVYALPENASVLHCFNIASDGDEGEMITLPVDPGHRTTLSGVHKSLVFGSSSYSPENKGLIWTFDLTTQQFKTYYQRENEGFINMNVYCGYLVVITGGRISFVDYRSDPWQLTVISTLLLSAGFRTELKAIKDGRLLMSGEYCNSSALIDFEHASDECEVLLVEKIKTQKSTPVAIKACELVQRATEWLGTKKIVSRYFKMNSRQRFGIIYSRDQGKSGNGKSTMRNNKGVVRKVLDVISQLRSAAVAYLGSFMWGNQQLALHNMDGIMNIKPEYNTPYMYYSTDPSEDDYIAWSVPRPVDQFFGKAIVFYEEFDGMRWKLSKPEHWITEKN